MASIRGIANRIFFGTLYYILAAIGSIFTLYKIGRNKLGFLRGTPSTILPTDNGILLTPAVELSKKIRSGKLKSEEVVKTFIERIQAVNPLLNAVIDERFDDALKDAREIDEEIKSELKKLPNSNPNNVTVYDDKPLLGIPFTAKDSAAIEGMLWTAGLKCRKGCRAKEDAPVIASLRSAGAIPLAVTNVPELLIWWDSSNTLYGSSFNPYNLLKITGGSSGGEAALLASAGSVIGVGSDIGGSIRIPSFMCGVFGHKTSPLMISGDGTFPEVEFERVPLMSYGPMTRYACDLIPMLKAMVPREKLSQLHLDEPVDLSSLKIFYMEDDGGSFVAGPMSSEMRFSMRQCVEFLRGEYKIPVTRVNFRYMKYAMFLWLNALTCPSSTPLDKWMANKEGKISLLRELGKALIGSSGAHHTLPCLVMACVEKLNPGVGSTDYKIAMKIIDKFKQEFRDVLGDNGVFLYPPHSETAPYHGTTIFKCGNCSYTTIFNVLEVPVTEVPLGLGKDSGMPVGVQVAANPRNDRLTIAVAKALEKKFGGWVPPFTVF